MPLFKMSAKKELPQDRGVEASDTSLNENSERTVKNEPASDPWVIGSSIVRRNEPDDED